MFALHTREAYVLPKSTCGNIMNDTSVLFQTFFHSFSELIVSRLENSGIDLSVDPTLSHLLNDDSFIQSMWINVNSDSRLKAYCKNNLGLVESETILLGYDEVSGKPQTYEYICVGDTLKRYLDHEDVWESINQLASKS